MKAPRYLLLGCGRSRDRRLDPHAAAGARLEPRQDFSDGELYTVDVDPTARADVRMSLDMREWLAESAADIAPRAGALMERVQWGAHAWHRFRADSFAEVHAYEVLEHLGHLGHVEEFFAHFGQIWRLLEPNGYLCGSVPSLSSLWLFGDPGHRRVITWEALQFLERPCPITPPSSNYRKLLDFDFARVWRFDDGQQLHFVLRAVKPARPFPEDDHGHR